MCIRMINIKFRIMNNLWEGIIYRDFLVYLQWFIYYVGKWLICKHLLLKLGGGYTGN